jgi:hypothetical protein
MSKIKVQMNAKTANLNFHGVIGSWFELCILAFELT